MNAGFSLLVAVLVSLGLSTILVCVLSKPLHRVLDAMCSTGETSQFWVSFVSVMFFIGPLLLSVMVFSPIDGQEVVRVLRTTLIATLFGAFIPLVAVGLRISVASPSSGAH